MPAQVARMCGDEWQRWGNSLLATHYGPTEYQKVPDNHRGDAGIEGFTITSGHAYQAYGCVEPISTAKRYESQRDKMTEDIGKFIRNQLILARLFGNTKITRWVLFVPYFDSREIVAHAATKTQEVLSANLGYISSEFHVIVADEDQFSAERDHLLNAGTTRIAVQAESATAEQIASWRNEHDTLTETLDTKLSKIPTIRTQKERVTFRDQTLKWFIEGQDILEALRKYPEVYEKVIDTKSHQENFLAMNAVTYGQSPAELLKITVDNLKTTFERELRQLSSLSSESLVHEAIADWLLRCPLDFPEQPR